MTIAQHRLSGLWVVTCDKCGNAIECPQAAAFMEAYHDAKADGWLAHREDDGWIHLCPTCLPTYHPSKPDAPPADLSEVEIIETLVCRMCQRPRQAELCRMEYFCTGVPEPRYHVRWRCLTCGHWVSIRNIGREEIATYGVYREQLPVRPRPVWQRRELA